MGFSALMLSAPSFEIAQAESASVFSFPIDQPENTAPSKLSRMTPSPHEHVTRVLVDWSRGDPDAPARLIPLVYEELRRLARHYLQRERADHTLQATGLVHEAYLHLVDQSSATWQNRAQFFSVAAQVMRRILVDYARAHRARNGGASGRSCCLMRRSLPLWDGE